VFVVDASVLLNLYRYPKAAREDLIKIFNQIADRLWVPHQAALEYQENRLRVIAEQLRRYDEVRSVTTDFRNKFQSELGKLQLKKRHSSINPDKLSEQIEKAFRDFLDELETLQKAQPDVFHDDPLRSEIDSLFNGKVGLPPSDQAELDKIYEEGEYRYSRKQPPGYMDAVKGEQDEKDIYTYKGLVFKREYGDLILWTQLIKESQAKENFKKLIFITDDEKEDWWWIVDSKGKKIIGPHPELVEEIVSKGGVSSFYMYNSGRFMTYAKKYLGIVVKQESIEQVSDITQLDRTKIDDAKNLLITTMAHLILQSENNYIPKAQLKHFMMKRNPSFDESDYGFYTFSAFLDNFPNIIKVIDNESGGHVGLVDAELERLGIGNVINA
jgi:hypothetical protein